MEEQFPIQQMLDGQGRPVDEERLSHIERKDIYRFYRAMLRIRLFDRKGISLQRQGRIGTYVPFEGQEAAQVGSALALEKEDWMFPTYRDHGAALTFGQTMKREWLYWRGRTEGALPPDQIRIFPPAVPIASQLLHAAGAAWAEKKKGTDRVSLVYFGDGATSEGDFHEGLNFASVFQLPVIFFNQNNGYAISVPFERQSGSKTIAQKALAYDIEGVRIDGNDVLVVYETVKQAIQKARDGGGPTLIEAVTWRYGAHTTADDPHKYRDQSESKRRREQTDPLLRLERFMQEKGWWDEDGIIQMTEEIEAEIETSIHEAEQEKAPEVDELFDYVFQDAPWPIQEQKRRLKMAR